jgi:hypothetical protein
VACPIAKRRAGLLGRVASPNGGINSLVLASGCCPVRFDLDQSLFSGLSQRQRTGVSALHKPILGALHQSTIYWVAGEDSAASLRGIPSLAQNARSGPPDSEPWSLERSQFYSVVGADTVISSAGLAATGPDGVHVFERVYQRETRRNCVKASTCIVDRVTRHCACKTTKLDTHGGLCNVVRLYRRTVSE